MSIPEESLSADLTLLVKADPDIDRTWIRASMWVLDAVVGVEDLWPPRLSQASGQPKIKESIV